MKIRYLVALATALSVSTAAFSAEGGEELFTKSKCAACHKLEDKKVGPTLKDVAAKYAGSADAQAMLEKKVRAGGVGVWGKMPMPRTPATVSDEEIKIMVEWMLSHK